MQTLIALISIDAFEVCADIYMYLCVCLYTHTQTLYNHVNTVFVHTHTLYHHKYRQLQIQKHMDTLHFLQVRVDLGFGNYSMLYLVYFTWDKSFPDCFLSLTAKKFLDGV